MKTFSEQVVEAALRVPEGRVTTYGDIAKSCGAGGQAARSVNAILVRAYTKGETSIPFHRIIYSNGRVWKKDAIIPERAEQYCKEGIIVNENGYVEDFLSKRWVF